MKRGDVGLTILEEDIRKHITSLAKIGNLGDSPRDGFLRASWSDEESGAMDYMGEKAIKEAKLDSGYDAVGNLYMRIPGDWDEIVQVGSHLDTVPEGGNYDGVAGIVAGFEAIKSIHASNLQLKKGLELVIWRGEESATFGAAYKGSRAAFGIAKPEILQNRFNGKTLEKAMIEQGCDSNYILEGRSTLSQEEIDSISAHLELHIEQAKQLEVEKKDIGIVTSIRGTARYLILVTGEFDHSGATPMTSKYRKDANLAIAHMQVKLDELAMHYITHGNDLVQTIGVVNSDTDINAKYSLVHANSLTKVSGFGYFMLDIRSNNNSFKEWYASNIEKEIKTIAAKFCVSAEIIEINSSDALEKLDNGIQEKIAKSCQELGYSYQFMPSGAGHDAAIVAKQTHSDGIPIPTGLIFIPCKNGKSHCKEEFSSLADIKKGAEVLAHTLYLLVS